MNSVSETHVNHLVEEFLTDASHSSEGDEKIEKNKNDESKGKCVSQNESNDSEKLEQKDVDNQKVNILKYIFFHISYAYHISSGKCLYIFYLKD